MKDELNIRQYTRADLSQVVSLWQECGIVVAWNNPELDIERKLKVNPELFLVGINREKIIATIMGGYEGHRGWINYLAVSPELQRKGFGGKMVREIERMLRKRGCPKINLQVRTHNKDVIRFYSSLGYTTDEVINMGKRLIEDS